MDNQIECLMCNLKIPQVKLLPHIPQCYREFCEKCNVEPYCTCNSCQGRKTHDDALPPALRSSPSPLKAEPRYHDMNASASSTKSDSKSDMKPENKPAQSAKANLTLLTANVCIVCEKRASPSQVPVPYINIGHHRQVMICTKKHLTEEIEHARVIEIIDQELAYIVEHGDNAASVIAGSDEEG